VRLTQAEAYNVVGARSAINEICECNDGGGERALKQEQTGQWYELGKDYGFYES
jgi:hypothetical protein